MQVWLAERHKHQAAKDVVRRQAVVLVHGDQHVVGVHVQVKLHDLAAAQDLQQQAAGEISHQRQRQRQENDSYETPAGILQAPKGAVVKAALVN